MMATAWRLVNNRSLWAPHSYCEGCGDELPWYTLLPLIGYVRCGGICQCCGYRVPTKYPVGEFCSGILVVGLYAATNSATYFFWAILLYSCLGIIALIDQESYWIPDQLVVLLIALGLLCRCMDDGLTYISFLGPIISFSSLEILRFLSRGGLGSGDSKLAGAISLFFPWSYVPIFLETAFLSGAICGALLLCNSRQRKQALPFAPFLAIGGMTTFLYGDYLIAQYLWYFSG